MGDAEGKLFTLKEAEQARAVLEPLLLEAMESRRKMADSGKQLGAIVERISQRGGILLSYEHAARLRAQHDAMELSVRKAIEQIESTGCVVKDLDAGLLDFPARLNNEDVYYCWRVGEDRIRFYHRQSEGFAGRKPIDPRDAGYHNPIQ
jgi:hypothetical protein